MMSHRVPALLERDLALAGPLIVELRTKHQGALLRYYSNHTLTSTTTCVQIETTIAMLVPFKFYLFTM